MSGNRCRAGRQMPGVLLVQASGYRDLLLPAAPAVLLRQAVTVPLIRLPGYLTFV